MKMSLTSIQKETLQYLREYFRKNGESPYLWEIQQYFKLKSIDAVRARLRALEHSGYVVIDHQKRRGIRLVGGVDETALGLDFVIRVKQALLAAGSLDEIYFLVILATVMKQMESQIGSIHLATYEYGARKLEPFVTLGAWEGDEPPRSFSDKEGLAGLVWRQRRGIVIDKDVFEHAEYIQTTRRKQDDPFAIMVVPFFWGDPLDPDNVVAGIVSLEYEGMPREGLFSTHNMEVVTEVIQRACYQVQHSLEWLDPFADLIGAGVGGRGEFEETWTWAKRRIQGRR